MNDKINIFTKGVSDCMDALLATRSATAKGGKFVD